MVAPDRRFVNLGTPRSVWAVGAIHSDCDRLAELHSKLETAMEPGDRLVYLGNMIGHGPEAAATLDKIITWRASRIEAGMNPDDIVYLRGMQEEMWQKMLQLQFAHKPENVLRWMVDHGLDTTLRAYGGDVDQGMAAARTGAIQLNRWTGGLRAEMHKREGHDALFSALRRAAFTEDGGMLLVSAGVNPDRPIGEQGDSLWWGHPGFESIEQPIEGFRRIVRGLDPDNGGTFIGSVAATLDGGSGRGGNLIASRILPQGDIGEAIEI